MRLAKGGPIEIGHELVESITPRMVPNGVSGQSLQVEIVYRTGVLSTDVTKPVLLGLQLSVQPINLLNALAAWQVGSGDHPSLLDRTEQVLRGHSTAAA